MKEIAKKHETKIRFATVGGLNTVLDFSILFILTAIGLPRISANIISTTISFLFSFTANRKFTFKSDSKNIKRQLVLFTVITLFGLWVIQGVIISILAPQLINLGFSDSISLLISKLVATIASLIWNYLLYSKVVFKN